MSLTFFSRKKALQNREDFASGKITETKSTLDVKEITEEKTSDELNEGTSVKKTDAEKLKGKKVD